MFCKIFVHLFLTVGAVYLKNCVYKYWKEREPGEVSIGTELPYSIPEQSKAIIRDNIIGGIIQSPTLIWLVP